jgi:hypothetical protein
MGSLAALSISTSLALFSSTGSQQVNQFAAGTVTLTSSSASTCLASKSNSCTYDISYTGTLPAWIGLTVGSANLQPSQFTVVDSVEHATFPPGSNEIVGAGIQTKGFSDTFKISFNVTLPTDASVTVSAEAIQAGNNTVFNSHDVATGPISWS